MRPATNLNSQLLWSSNLFDADDAVIFQPSI
jgi:hypothetical protein